MSESIVDLEPAPSAEAAETGANLPAVSPGRPIIDQGKLYELIDDFDADLIVRGVAPERVEAWCYSFRQEGTVITGLSVWGVQNAIREMARHGEIIRLEEPKIVRENDDEILLTCTARRMLAHPETGVMIEVDQATRGLRQTKYMMVNVYEGSGQNRRSTGKVRQEDPKWWEKAFSKAQRNAALPLLREDCKTAIVEAYKATEKYRASAGGGGNRGGGNVAPARAQARVAAPQRQAPAPPPQRQDADPRVLEQIYARMRDMRETWDADSYMQLYREAQSRYFPGRKMAEATFTAEQAAGLLAYLRGAQGEPPPPENEAPTPEDSGDAPAEEGAGEDFIDPPPPED